MRLEIKPGVRFASGQQAMDVALMAARELWEEYGAEVLRITSCIDGKHSVGSRHYLGLAYDLDTNPWIKEVTAMGLPKVSRATRVQRLAEELQRRIGPDFFVEAEFYDMDSEHIHVDYRPKGPINQ